MNSSRSSNKYKFNQILSEEDCKDYIDVYDKKKAF